MDRSKVDELWGTHVGCRRLAPHVEISSLRKAHKSGALDWWEVHALYLTTKRWASIRKKVLVRDGYACVKCKSTLFLHVDHIKYSKEIGKERLGDLQTLCILCHADKTKRKDLLSGHDMASKKVVANEGNELFTVLRRRS
jgi:5-methylcytosine-specific restriction endonuclease McrA